MFHAVTVTEETKAQATEFLSTPNLYTYWIMEIAVDYQGGSYLKTASMRSKKICFARWKAHFENIVNAPIGAVVL